MNTTYKTSKYHLQIYQSMINDKVRNQFYHRLLGRHVKDKIVVDVGFGTGLLSIMALELGARQVIAYEQHYEMYKLGVKLIKHLGLEDKIELINNRFNTTHLRGNEDLLIHEIFAENLWGEYLLYSLQNCPIPIIPNIYQCKVNFHESASEKIYSVSNFKEKTNNKYQFDPGIPLSSELVTKTQQLLEAEINLPKTQLECNPTGEQFIKEQSTVLLEYQIDTNRQDFPHNIEVDLKLPVGSYVINFEYSFGDDSELLCITDDYEGKSWDSFEECGNAFKLQVIQENFKFFQTLTNGSYYFGER